MADPIANPFPPDPNLTPVHLAVLQDDLAQLSALVRSREWGIDALDARRATPIMLAALSGRPTAFLFLLENGASLRREDAQGLTAVDYLRAANVESLASRYQPHARKRFSKRRGRLMIRATLKALRQSPQGGSEKADTSSPVPPPGRENDTMPPAQAPSADETLEIILHTKEKDVIFGTLSIQARAYFEQDLHEKTMGAIRGRAQGSPFHVIAISGWRGDQACKGTTVLNNAQYTALVKEVSQMYGLALRSNPLDKPFYESGTAEERLGMFYCCHVERQLATWLVEECVSRLLATRSITVENVAQVKQKLEMLPAELRETVIELDHTPCRYCVEYIELLQEKSGLAMELKSRPWFMPGKRKGTRPIDPSLLDKPAARRQERKRRRLEQKAVDTGKYRQGPAQLTNPFEAPTSSDTAAPSSSQTAHADDLDASTQDESDQVALRLLHKSRASLAHVDADNIASSPPRPATATPERERKRQKRLSEFKDVVNQFTHVPVEEQLREREPGEEEGLSNVIAVEPFPGATIFALDED